MAFLGWRVPRGAPLLIEDRFGLVYERFARFLVRFQIVIFLVGTQRRATTQGLLILGPLLVAGLHGAHALHDPGDERGPPESLLPGLCLHGRLSCALSLNTSALCSDGFNLLFFKKHVASNVILCREMSFLPPLSRLWSNLYQILIERVDHLSRVAFVVAGPFECLLGVVPVKCC